MAETRGFPPVRRAAFAWWGATACWFLGSLLGTLLGGHVAAGTGVSRTTRDVLPTPVAVLVFVVLAGLWALLVHGMYRGAGWARIVLAVAGALGILNVVARLFVAFTATGQNTGDVVQVLLFVVALGLSMAGFVLMFRADAGPYFAGRRRPGSP
jgi:hypothetical protein